MQSLASLMSMKQADIGNLDDFEEENEEDEENRVNQEEKAAKITGEQLECFTYGSSWQKGRIATSASSPTSAFQKKKKKSSLFTEVSNIMYSHVLFKFTPRVHPCYAVTYVFPSFPLSLIQLFSRLLFGFMLSLRALLFLLYVCASSAYSHASLSVRLAKQKPKLPPTSTYKLPR